MRSHEDDQGDAKPIWEILQAIGDKVPESEWRKLKQSMNDKDHRIAHLRAALGNIRDTAKDNWAATYAGEILEMDE